MSAAQDRPLARPLAASVLELTLWGEAAGRPVRATEGIAAVVMNRVRLAAAPGGPQHLGQGVAAVCRAPFQFPCWLPARRAALREAMRADDPALAICRRIAARALAGALPDPTRGATHYHPAEILPRWALGRVPTVELGGVVFYRLLG
ncbi:cell wall hydrolase [Falsiroseomonas selenitidurans]|uniref:Cell wall hydrolase n=1 Tax=Falsiroseomonas selenitidurans TaxID=2716335 RepID=A0ABX1DWX9_9PROT|nr:cell wall hydrolase [Falsiroseomonas selenitidurans]NKC29420.1 cell wall hydrolase [Falsiroseomonas selenitidurans]